MTTTVDRDDELLFEQFGVARPALPRVWLPRVPSARVLWRRSTTLIWAVTGLVFLDRLTKLLMDFWFFQSLGFQSVFWTNFRVSAVLWIAVGLAITAAIAGPTFILGLPRATRRRALQVGLLVGVLVGYHFAGDYRDYLAFLNAQPFGKHDPLFHHDIGFYVFRLPAIWTTLRYAIWVSLAGLVSCVVCSWRTRPVTEPVNDMNPVTRFLGTIGTTATIVALAITTVLLAIEVFLGRYNLLVKNNSSAAIHGGAAYLDVRGPVSNLVFIYVVAVVVLAEGVTIAVILRRLRQRVMATTATPVSSRTRAAVIALVVLELIEPVAFRTALSVRNMTQVRPNEPAVQLQYIQRHLDATRAAWGLDHVQSKDFVPSASATPPPDVASLVNSPTFANGNAPLWPGFTSYLSRVIDPDHAARYVRTGDPVVLGVTLDSFNQQQKLRGYYDFMGVDTVRYPINGQPRLFASSVREVPLVEPKPWLSWWGQRFLLFTHGHGLVMAPLGQADKDGQPVYASKDIPIHAQSPELSTRQPAVYYGEGAGSMAYSDIRHLQELDYATDEGRATVEYPSNVRAGVKVNSLLKRIVFGWRSRQLFQIVFSNLVTQRTRVHYYRTPMERVERVAPFLYFDTSTYAVAAKGGITWMVNGIASTDRYPYSFRDELGDLSNERTTAPRPMRRANYARDAVKATIDAYTGDVHFYAISDDPIMRTWEKVYPHLFEAKAAMPTTVRQQVQYPVHLFHTQFDHVYVNYHMPDALTFFNLEDTWQSGQQVMGPVLGEGGQITFPIEPYYWMAQSGGLLPSSSADQQFALSMAFSNRDTATNLRALPTVYMTGADYGKLFVLTVPKGTYSIGPNQADAAIDQDSFISQQIGFWTRRGLDVIRGQLSTVVSGGELVYVEPLFIRSKQNPVPQLKRVLVVLRGKVAMGRDLPEALNLAANRQTPTFGLGD